MASQSQSWKSLTVAAKLFIGLVVTLGTGVLLFGAIHQSSKNIAEFICYLGIAVLASRMKVNLPGITGTMSVNFLFVLLGVLELSFSETLILGCVSILVQSFYPDRPNAIQVTFNVCAGALSTALAYFVYHHPFFSLLVDSRPLLLGVAACTYFIANTGSIATVISLTEGKRLKKIIVDCYFWSFPYYLVGAGIAGAIGWFNQTFYWETSLLLVPAIYVIYRSYRLYLGKLEDEKRHVEEMASLHLRTIEALALAIEAKDQTTHDHLQRVRIYAVEVAKELGVTDDEMQAVHAAALLHDSGKLAVPEHIISKPGRLTLEEFEKMKIHPVVGAEILQRVRFPYPVVPIVRAHHEKWDGSGYPYGLKGAEIPIGARILSVVDCLDALATDRQYRRALPLDEAMAKVASEAGTAFDPDVVQALQARYQELEARARTSEAPAPPPLSVDIKITRGSAPAAGFETEAPTASAAQHPVAQARTNRRVQNESKRPDLPAPGLCSLQWEETLMVASRRLRRRISYDAIALWACEEDYVRVKFADGEERAELESLAVRQGEGLVGWVAEVGKPILNGNPAVEPGYAKRDGAVGLASALALDR